MFYIALCIKDEARRKAFLEQTCAKNPEMRVEVESLLAVQADAEKFFTDVNPQTGGSGHSS